MILGRASLLSHWKGEYDYTSDHYALSLNVALSCDSIGETFYLEAL